MAEACARDTGAPPESARSGQAESAARLVKCLQDKDIPAVLDDWGDGQAAVRLETSQAYYMCLGEHDCRSSAGPDDSDAAYEELESLAETLTDRHAVTTGLFTLLVIDGADMTETLATCVESGEYTSPEVVLDPGQELRDKQATVAATNDWIACARANGLPDIEDVPAPKADGWQTIPTALLPPDMTLDEITDLGRKCPPLNVEAHTRQLEEQGSPDYDPAKAPSITEPSIGFDARGWRGDLSEGGGDDTEMEDRLAALLDALDAVSAEFWESHRE
jgi:hypothetical protein